MPRKKKKQLKASLPSGILFIGDAQFFAGSPVLELNPATGEVTDVTPIDPLNPFNTMDRSLDLAGDDSTNLEIGPYIEGRGVLINTHLSGSLIIKKRHKQGKLVGISINIKQ